MLKHIIVLIIVSILALLLMKPIGYFLHFIYALYQALSHFFLHIFGGGPVNHLIIQVISLVIISLGVSLIPAFLYWLLQRREMPYFPTLLWLIWTLFVAVLAMHY